MEEPGVHSEIKNGRRKLSEGDPSTWKYVTDLLGEAIKNPLMLPSAAAFGVGAMIGYENEGDAQGAIRVGLESVLFTNLALMTSVTPETRLFGLAGLTGIGLSLPFASIVKEAQRSLKIEEALALESTGLTLSPERKAELSSKIEQAIFEAWEAFLKNIGLQK